MIEKQVLKVVLSKLAQARLQNSIETINRKIQRLAQAFGSKSYTFKNEVAFLQKGALQKFVGESASGFLKVDYMKIKKFIQAGNDLSEVNEILTKMAGVKMTSDGEMIRTGDKIPTVGQLRKEAKKKMEELGTGDTYNVDEFIESMNKFASEFQTEYQKAMVDVGGSDMKEDPIVGLLWSENRTKQSSLAKPRKGESGKGKLSYSELTKIYERMVQMRIDAKVEEEVVEDDPLPF